MASKILRPGAGVIFMKVGTHAQESLKDIIARKRLEIEAAGRSFWGYGGGTCHPLSTVQPFARDFIRKSGVIYLCMQPMESHHFAVGRAQQYSTDGVHWEPIPKGIEVRGSRYALVVEDIREEQFDLPLAGTRVAAGNSQGRSGDQFIGGHVDKACLEVVDPDAEGKTVNIGLVAKLVEPYAVLVKS